MPFTEILGDLLCIGHFLGIILYTMNFFSNVVFFVSWRKSSNFYRNNNNQSLYFRSWALSSYTQIAFLDAQKTFIQLWFSSYLIVI